MISPTPVVLFDFDGTLADTIPLIIASYHAILPRATTDAQIRSWIGRTLMDVLEEQYPGQGEQLTTDYRAWNLANHDELIRPVPGIDAVLDDLNAAGRKVAVVSSKMTDTVWLGLKAVGLEEKVSAVFGQECTQEHKPSPAPLLHAAERLETEPARATYVGDAWVDVAAATAAGMASIAVTWGAGQRHELEGADRTVEHVDELRGALGL